MGGSNTGGVGFSQFYYNPPMPVTPGAVVGSMPPQPWVRSVLDARRMMLDRTPNAEYPDGFLGTITDRRNDRLFDQLQARVSERGYQRGVHLGERIDPGDYLWPDELGPFSALQMEARGERWAPLLEYYAPTPVVEGKLAPRASESVITIDKNRATQLSLLRPRYGLPARRQLTPQG